MLFLFSILKRKSFYLVSVNKVDYFVIPAEAGIQNQLKSLDSRFHGNDGKAIYKQALFNLSRCLKSLPAANQTLA